MLITSSYKDDNWFRLNNWFVIKRNNSRYTPVCHTMMIMDPKAIERILKRFLSRTIKKENKDFLMSCFADYLSSQIWQN